MGQDAGDPGEVVGGLAGSDPNTLPQGVVERPRFLDVRDSDLPSHGPLHKGLSSLSALSCSHVILMCEIRSQELVDSPPQDVCDWSHKDILEIILSNSIQAPLFGWNQVLFS